jgi:hypothetical protein
MGFYIRKSFKFGPLRLNLSKSGLGASVGTKGARLGLSSKGKLYTHLGRWGLYHRQDLGSVELPPATSRNGIGFWILTRVIPEFAMNNPPFGPFDRLTAPSWSRGFDCGPASGAGPALRISPGKS